MTALTQNETTMENVFGDDKEHIIQLRKLVKGVCLYFISLLFF